MLNEVVLWFRCPTLLEGRHRSFDDTSRVVICLSPRKSSLCTHLNDRWTSLILGRNLVVVSIRVVALGPWTDFHLPPTSSVHPVDEESIFQQCLHWLRSAYSALATVRGTAPVSEAYTEIGRSFPRSVRSSGSCQQTLSHWRAVRL